MHGHRVTEVRLLIEWSSRLSELCAVGFSERDTSLYLRPVPPTGRVFAGTSLIPAGARNLTFPFVGQSEILSPEKVKLSIHATGQIHAKVDASRGRVVAGPLRIPSLATAGGQHIATITADDFACLLPINRVPTIHGPKVDFAFPFGSHSSGRVVLYANAVEPKFVDAAYWITLHRPDSGEVLYLGIAATPQDPLASSAEGFTLITGWDPSHAADDLTSDRPFMFLRCV
jgi:hypothetical protein